MVCLGLKHGVTVWKAETNPLSYGGTPQLSQFFTKLKHSSISDVRPSNPLRPRAGTNSLKHF